MDHLDRLSQSSTDLWRNPSVLGVLLLQYILVMLVVVLFVAIDAAIIWWLNSGTLGPLLSADQFQPEALLNAIWNARTISTIVAVGLIQLVLLLLLSSIFTAGALGMMRNLLLDGSTRFQEFPSMARRFTGQVFRFTLLRYALLAIPIGLFLFAVLSVLGTTPELIDSTQIGLLITSGVILLVVGVLVAFLLMYGDAVIVFEDLGALHAARRTLRIVREHPGTSIAAGLLGFTTIIVLSIIVSLLTMPLSIAADATGSAGLLVGEQVVSFLGNIILMAAGLVVTIFLFRTYRHLTGGTVRTAPYRTRKSAAAKKKA